MISLLDIILVHTWQLRRKDMISLTSHFQAFELYLNFSDCTIIEFIYCPSLGNKILYQEIKRCQTFPHLILAYHKVVEQLYRVFTMEKVLLCTPTE